MQRQLFVLFLLALTQITGWGVVSVLPVIATTVAVEFRTSLSMIFVGTSVLFVAMGLAAPWTGRAFRRFGPHSVMVAGAGMIAVGLCLLALSPGLLAFWAAWAVIGIAGSMFLTTFSLRLYRGLRRGSGAEPYRYADAGNGSGG